MRLLLLALCLASGVASAQEAIRHSFLATGGQTRLVDGEGKTTWRFPASTRDGWVLPDGNILLAVSKNAEFPGGAALEVRRDGTRVWTYKGTQSEVNTVQKLANGNYVLTEAGAKPRVLEIDAKGAVISDVAIQSQTANHHMESRMTRKLPNGNFLVPQLLDRVVREYAPDGKIVWEWKTPDDPKECWPFTAIRLANSNTLITLTHGNKVVEVNAKGEIVWEISNADLPGNLINDACGAQRLPNGNTVICSYAIGANRTKLIEVTPDKKLVWSFSEPTGPGIHEVHILDTNDVPLEGAPLR
jgi:hypothetical protein